VRAFSSETFKRSYGLSFCVVFACLGAYILTQAFAAINDPRADINADNKVDIQDLSLLLTNFNKTTAESSTPKADINGDGKVTITDLSILLTNFGSSATPTPASGNPFATTTVYNDRTGDQATAQANAWRTSKPTDAALLDKIATQPRAVWLGEWSGDIRAATDAAVGRASAAGQMALLVAYNIPGRDCGSFSAGGSSSATAYSTWIANMANGINGRKVAIILEPDAIPQSDCLSQADRTTRYSLLKQAAETLSSKGAYVYMDIGHAEWLTAAEAANRLTQVGVSSARGFSLNVSNFIDTPKSTAYGNDVSSRLGGKPFVIDTSRNGLGAGDTWCNPTGRALGERPHAGTGNVDALLWIKPPGESDGTCNGGPNAGTFWPDYALGLAQRAAW
jgi:endoglucanase